MSTPTSPDLQLEPGLHQWLARERQLQHELAPVDPDDWPARRVRDRQLSDALADQFAARFDDRCQDQQVELAGRPARLIRPRDVAGPMPTQLFLHGGGFVTGTAFERLNGAVLSERAVRGGVQIVAMDYRLAPEHPFPAGLDDVLAGFAELQQQADRWNVLPGRLGLGGNSAGGHQAIMATIRLRDALTQAGAPPMPHHLLVEVPAVDLTGTDWPSMGQFATPDQQRDLYAVGAMFAAGSNDPILSPVRLDDLTSLPPTLVMTAEFDPLRGAAEAFVARLQQSGVPAHGRRGAGQLHGTTGLCRASASARAWQSAAIAELRRHYRTDPTTWSTP